MRWVSPLVFVIACTPATSDPADECGAAICAASEVCDRSIADPACIDGAADADSDGVANKDDLCPHLAGTTNFDEDGDGIGDECDRCPIAPPAVGDALDHDGDAVDYPCDPNPDTPGDKIVRFEGFRQSPPGTVLPPGWEITGGEAIARQAGPSPGFFSLPIAGASRLAVEASYRIDSIVTTGNATPAVSTVTRDKRPAGTVEYLCGVAKMSTTEGVVLTTDVESTNASALNMFDSAALYRSGFLVDGGQTACAVIANDTVKKSTSARGGGNAMTEAGIDVANATARFQWVMVLSWTPPT